MKNSVKLFGVVAVSLFLFSCSTDELDADLERAISVSENINYRTGTEEPGDDNNSEVTSQQEGTPYIIVKRD